MAERKVHDGAACVTQPGICEVVCLDEDHEHFDRRQAWACAHPHAHEWDEDHFCAICGADGLS